MSPGIPDSVAAAVGRLREAVEQERLPYEARVRLSIAVRRQVVPRRKSGPKDSRLDAAWADYRTGLRGLKLFKKHIPRHDKMGRWRRKIEEKRLMNTLQQRASRERRQKARQESDVTLEEGHPSVYREQHCVAGSIAAADRHRSTLSGWKARRHLYVNLVEPRKTWGSTGKYHTGQTTADIYNGSGYCNAEPVRCEDRTEASTEQGNIISGAHGIRGADNLTGDSV
jgi:hypothetical protein